jgi:hypothetical protein
MVQAPMAPAPSVHSSLALAVATSNEEDGPQDMAIDPTRGEKRIRLETEDDEEEKQDHKVVILNEDDDDDDL